MKRYCPKCKAVGLVECNHRGVDACAACGCSLTLQYTLRQQAWLYRYYLAHKADPIQVQVSGKVFNRTWEHGWIYEVVPDGLVLHFDKGPCGLEHWQWNELEIEVFARVPKDDDALEALVAPDFKRMREFDMVMLRDGRVGRIGIRRESPNIETTFELFGAEITPCVFAPDLFSRVVDWLPAAELQKELTN